MIQSMQPIIRHLFQAETLEDVTRERLEAFVEEYPSFGIGHYLLSRKLRTGDAGEGFAGNTRRTNLYFTNPFWLQWMLENAASNINPSIAKSQDSRSIPVMDLAAGSHTATQDLIATVPLPGQEEPASQASEEDIPQASEEPIRDEEPPFILEEMQPSVQEAASAATGEPEVANNETSPTPPGFEASNTPSAAEALLQSIRDAHGLRESLQRINENEETDQEPSPPEENEPNFTGNTIGSTLEKAAREAGIGTEKTAESGTGSTPHQIKDDGPIAFEPYHTIDYFASQGIKLTPAQEENPGDSLGRQLKSFTDWLKVMRKLPQKDRELVPDLAAERTIQTIAAHSIEGKEVVTEAMAEVLLKQGMPAKAREVYEKLSLLNPGKSAYFAAKIEQLNIH
jgi:hypothetical protein